MARVKHVFECISYLLKRLWILDRFFNLDIYNVSYNLYSNYTTGHMVTFSIKGIFQINNET